MKPLLVTSGEPAGVGPDVCLDLIDISVPVVVMADKMLMQQRADMLQRKIQLVDYNPNVPYIPNASATNQVLPIIHIPCQAEVTAGVLNVANAPYVLAMLQQACQACLQGDFSGVVTAPVHKGIINDAGFAFSGHTEFFAKSCGVDHVVMMLASEQMRVALVTTHLPLAQVSTAISKDVIQAVVRQVHQSLQHDFGIRHPTIAVAGLNPHAGEGGHLGHEEIEVIAPALESLRKENSSLTILGPLSADTMFTLQKTDPIDAYVVMYHDQGLPVLKYASFGNAVNITLGLPIVRTSVDHGTALALAGTGQAHSGSLLTAVNIAWQISQTRQRLTGAHHETRYV